MTAVIRQQNYELAVVNLDNFSDDIFVSYAVRHKSKLNEVWPFACS